MIQKNIFTIWISEKDLPEKYKESCATHKLDGYKHRYITLEDAKEVAKTSKYLQEVLEAKKYIKASDYLRMYYLYNEGGIYLDCDMAILKPFDDLLNNKMFHGREDYTILGNSVVGAEKGHPLIKKYLEIIESNFRGSGELIFEPAERLFADLVMGYYGKFGGVTTYSAEYFFPFNDKGEGEITENSYTNHGFTRSWK